MARIIIRYLRDHLHWKAGTEVWDLIESAQPLIDAGIAEYVRDTYLPERDPKEVEKEFEDAISAALRAQVLEIMRAEGISPPPSPSENRFYGEKEIVEELNRRNGTSVSVKHGMKWLRKKGARFEPSDRPGARTSLIASELDRLGITPVKPSK